MLVNFKIKELIQLRDLLNISKEILPGDRYHLMQKFNSACKIYSDKPGEEAEIIANDIYSSWIGECRIGSLIEEVDMDRLKALIAQTVQNVIWNYAPAEPDRNIKAPKYEKLPGVAS